jgi:hypothetical protein
MAISPRLKSGISYWRSGAALYIGDRFNCYLLPESIGERNFLETLSRLEANTLEKIDQPLIAALSRLNLIDRKITEIPYQYRADNFALSSIDGTRSLALQQFLERFEIEAESVSHRPGNVDGGRTQIISRKTYPISIHAIGTSNYRIAVNLFANLKASGFESCQMQLSGEVEIGELMGTQLLKTDLSSNRAEVLKRIDRDASLYPEAIPEIPQVKFAVSIGTPNPELQQTWLQNNISYLIINATSNSVRVGPVVKPGVTACANCLSLTEIASGHLPESGKYFRPAPVREPSAALSLLGTALASLAVAQIIDTGTSELLGKSLRFTSGSLVAPEVTNWELQPACGCIHIASTRATSL